MKKNIYYNLTKEKVMEKLDSNPNHGLTEIQVQSRLQKFGKNELIEKHKKTPLVILFDQLKEIMVFVLLGAAIVSLFLHEYIDSLVIFIILALNTMLGFWQELKAEKALSALKKLTVPVVRVKRDGMTKEIKANELVPGDIIILETGNIIPADARILETSNLKLTESALTGESVSIEKQTRSLKKDEVPLAEQNNMVFMGTIVSYGRGEAVVTATGMQTELGHIATMLESVEDDKTPLQKRLAKLGTSLAIAALFLIILVGAISILQGNDWKLTFLTAISMAVAAIPEGLPAVVTIALALGAQKMLKRNSLIRRLPAVETLGSVTVICSDKTGTLTQNKMTVTQVIIQDKIIKQDNFTEESSQIHLRFLLAAAALCNDAVLKHENTESLEALGDPTEGALIIAAEKINLNKQAMENLLPRTAEFPFDSSRKRMTTVHHKKTALEELHLEKPLTQITMDTNEYFAFTKGSADGLLNICDKVLINEKVVILTEKIKNQILEQNKNMANNGIRVLGVSVKSMDKNSAMQTEQYEKNMIFLGLIGMTDPIRPEVKDAVLECKDAGIRPVMITGDHPLTASAIARQLSIAENNQYLTGSDLSKMSVKELEDQVNDVSVYARVAPEHKMKIIDALQDKGQVVAMTGDGVNDAPALKSADIGVAMGITGTDVAKESSDMVLVDDNFTTIVHAVEEGRTIYDNIKKFIKYILTGNTGEIMVMLLGPLLGLPIPLFPIQILWINLVTDGIPAVALGYEKAEKNIMNKPPVKPNEGIFARGLGWQILYSGFLVSMVSLAVGYSFFKADPHSPIWQTSVFCTLTFCQMILALCFRSKLKSIFLHSLSNNLVMLFGVLLTFALQLTIIYVPFMQSIFKTTALNLNQLGICLGASCLLIIPFEIQKLIFKEKH